ncbi:MAG: hypothetical protein IT235_08350 [Bacteroidia bacterium]|nr:hypothetical protein [Bacteroidia bacterium]
MRSLLLAFSFLFFSFQCVAQFESLNAIGVGINVPAITAIRDIAPFPSFQIDYKHEFYFGTRNPSVDKSIETRFGISALNFPSTWLYMGNIGVQRSLVETYFLHAVGIDFIGFMFEAPRVFGDKIFKIVGTGKGKGVGAGVFYKFGYSLSKNISATAEVGAMFAYDYYAVSYGGPTMWSGGYSPNVALYRANVSLNYHF